MIAGAEPDRPLLDCVVKPILRRRVVLGCGVVLAGLSDFLTSTVGAFAGVFAGLPRFFGSTTVPIALAVSSLAEVDARFRVKLYCGSPIEVRLGRPVGDTSGISDVPPVRTFFDGLETPEAAAFRFLGGMI